MSLRSRGALSTLVAAILALHFMLGVAYSIVTPIGEGHDEWAHFAYIRHIVTERELPAPLQRLVPEVMFDEIHQPPLYYLIGALASSWIDMSDDLRPVPNTHLQTLAGGRNVFLHEGTESWPYRGSTLGFHVVRIVSVAMGTIVVLAGYLIAAELLPGRRQVAVAALALTAFMPQLLFIGSIVTNDIAVAMFSALVALALVRIALRGYSARRALLLYSSLGCAVLSKANALALVPAAAIVLILAARRSESRAARGAMLWAALPAFLGIIGVFGAWEARNAPVPERRASLIDALGTFILHATRGSTAGAPIAPRAEVLLEVPGYAFRTFWAVFGWGNIPVDPWIYTALGLLSGAALVGCTVFFARGQGHPVRPGWQALALTGLFTLLLPLGLVAVTGDLYASFPGRYVISLAPAVGLCIALGLPQLMPRRVRPIVLCSCALCMLALAVAVPFCYIRPAYAGSPLLTPADLAAVPHTVFYRFGDAVELAGYEVQPTSLHPGDMIAVSLYWRSLAATDENYSVIVQALDPGLDFYGGVDANLGYPQYPTSRWRAGDIVKQTFRFRLGATFPSPAFVRVKVVVVSASGPWLPVLDGQGQPVGDSATFGRTRVAADAPAVIPSPPGPTAIFGDAIRLQGSKSPVEVRAGQPCLVTLYWEALRVVDRDYTVFVHLIDENGKKVTQHDGQPCGGSYPTSLWLPGEVVEDAHQLLIPGDIRPGEYRVVVGLYLLDTLARLPAVDRASQPLPGEQQTVAAIRVVPP